MSVAEFNFDIAVSTLIAVIIAVYYKRRYGDEIFNCLLYTSPSPRD